MLSRRAGLSAIAGLSCFVRPHFLPCRCRSRLPTLWQSTAETFMTHLAQGNPLRMTVCGCVSHCVRKRTCPRDRPPTVQAENIYAAYSLVQGRSQSWNHLRLHAAMTSWTTGTPRLFLVLGNRTWRHFSCLSLLCLVVIRVNFDNLSCVLLTISCQRIDSLTQLDHSHPSLRC